MQSWFSFSISPDTFSVTLWVIFIAVTLVWAVTSGILWFHWRAYGADTKRVKRIRRTYLTGSLVLLILAMSFILSL